MTKLLSFRSNLLFALSAGALLAACAGDLPDNLVDDDGSGGSGGSPTTSTTTTTTGPGGGGTGGGGTGGGGGSEPQAAVYEIAVDRPAPEMELRAETDIVVTVTPNGYVGPVTLAVQGTPTDVTAAFEANTIDLDGATAATVTLTLSTLSDTVTGDFPLMVTGVTDGGTKEASIALKVLPQITVVIPANVQNLTNTTNSFGDYPTMVKTLPNLSAANPIRVRFFNSDGVPRQIHAAQGDQGFGHSQQDIPAGGYDNLQRPVNAAGTYNFYMHGITGGETILGRIVIQ
ncbi:MAG TPA: hypothetical protein VLS89_08770 [Candidatus Nanopelagicales bacterium]|nr:hypothetical protein [Candidatus Nanopelagicales bacterium]